MVRRWMAAGLLLLAACRSDGTRGASLTTETTPAPQGLAAWRTEVPRGRLRSGTLAEQAATLRVWTMVQALLEAELAASRLAEKRAPSPEVQDHAAKVVEENTEDLRALTGVPRADGLDLDAPSVQRDPALEAQRREAEEALARLRPLTGEAFEAAYLAAQPASLARLAALAEQGERSATSVDVGDVFRMIAHQARERARRVEALTPEACGGQRAGGTAPDGRR